MKTKRIVKQNIVQISPILTKNIKIEMSLVFVFYFLLSRLMKENITFIFIILENLTPIYNIKMVFGDKIYSIVNGITNFH